ncbi:MAG: DUF354 domain-containing protein [Thermodesulfobacteriota bacterium]
MHILADITHPAHVHFFKNAIALWRRAGHKVTITTRGKDITLTLLDNLGLAYTHLGPASVGLSGLARELPVRDCKLARVILREKPDVLVAIGGVFIAHAGFLTRTPSVVFYDTENARLQNLITYPLSTLVVTPDCYEAWAPKKKNIRYAGYHELAYCHPLRFTPDPAVLSLFGLKEGERFIVVRLVSWGATHDVLDKGVTDAEMAVGRLSDFGKVLITSERPLPGALEKHRITASPELVHHLLYYADLFIGESATMASESACLGTPAVFVSTSVRGYTNEQGRRYGITFTYSDPDTGEAEALKKAEEILADPEGKKKWREKSAAMLRDKIDVTDFMVNLITERFDPARRGGKR